MKLTSHQQIGVLAILKERQQSIQAILNGSKFETRHRILHIEAVIANADGRVRALLTPVQQLEFDEITAAKKRGVARPAFRVHDG